MNVPTIHATTCPQTSELGDKARRWAIVYSTCGRAYLGRIVGAEDVGAILTLEDPFDYASAREVFRGDDGPRMRVMRQVFPCEHFDLDSILVGASVIVALCKLSPKALELLRADLIPAWEGREALRKMGGRLTIASAGTKIEAPST